MEKERLGFAIEVCEIFAESLNIVNEFRNGKSIEEISAERQIHRFIIEEVIRFYLRSK